MRSDPESSGAPSPARTSVARRLSWLPPVIAAIALAALALPAEALPGPDPSSAAPHFSIVVNGGSRGDSEVLQEIGFDRAANWDFGDRESYRCAYVEYIVGGQVLFRLEFERLAVPGEPVDYIAINDRHGIETGEGGVPPVADDCGMPADGGPRSFDGSPFVAGGATFTVYQDTAPLTTYALPATSPENPEVAWSVGDDAGEAYMWYAESGEDLEAVLRFTIVPVAPGISLSPTNPSPSPGGQHRSAVTLALEGRLRAVGQVRVPDGLQDCASGRLVLIERRVSGQWTDAGRDLTTKSGTYGIRLADREGTYRARVQQVTLADGGVCGAAVSPTRDYVRRRG